MDEKKKSKINKVLVLIAAMVLIPVLDLALLPIGLGVVFLPGVFIPALLIIAGLMFGSYLIVKLIVDWIKS